MINDVRDFIELSAHVRSKNLMGSSADGKSDARSKKLFEWCFYIQIDYYAIEEWLTLGHFKTIWCLIQIFWQNHLEMRLVCEVGWSIKDA